MIPDLARKELQRHKLRTILTITGIIIGIVLITTLGAFTEGIRVGVGEELNFISGLVTVTQEDLQFGAFQLSELDQELVDELSQLDDVDLIAPVILSSAEGYTITGFDMGKDSEIFSEVLIGVESGREYEPDSNEVVLGSQLADETDLVSGDTITIRGTDLEVVGIWRETGSPEDDESVTMSLETAQRIVGREDKVTMIFIKPTNVNDIDNLVNIINKDFDGVMAFSKADAENEAKNFVGQLNVMIYVVGGIASIIAGIVIMNVMYMSVRERRRQIGTMKAVGATDRQVISQVIGESLFITMFGGIIGIIISAVIVFFINAALGSSLAKITFRLVISSLTLTAVLGTLGGVLPARQAAKINPIEALRYE